MEAAAAYGVGCQENESYGNVALTSVMSMRTLRPARAWSRDVQQQKTDSPWLTAREGRIMPTGPNLRWIARAAALAVLASGSVWVGRLGLKAQHRSGAATTAAVEDPAPKSSPFDGNFRFTHKFPPVIGEPGARQELAIKVVNRSQDPVTFSQEVTHSCSCADATLRSFSLAPDETTRLDVSINLTGQ